MITRAFFSTGNYTPSQLPARNDGLNRLVSCNNHVYTFIKLEKCNCPSVHQIQRASPNEYEYQLNAQQHRRYQKGNRGKNKDRGDDEEDIKWKSRFVWCEIVRDWYDKASPTFELQGRDTIWAAIWIRRLGTFVIVRRWKSDSVGGLFKVRRSPPMEG